MAYEGIPPLVASVTKAVVKMADGLTEQEKRDLQFVFDVYDPKANGADFCRRRRKGNDSIGFFTIKRRY